MTLIRDLRVFFGLLGATLVFGVSQTLSLQRLKLRGRRGETPYMGEASGQSNAETNLHRAHLHLLV